MRLILIIMALCFSHSTAYASWVEARSKNFIFTGNVSEKKAEIIVNELEVYREILFEITNLKESNPEVVPIQIYGFKSSHAIKDITKAAGVSDFAGVYTTNREGPVFAINVSSPFTKNSFARAIAYHEYTHHLISTYSDLVYPRWYNEGYADYLSTFHIDKNGFVEIGLPNEFRARALVQARGGWLDMDILTRAIRKYPWGKGKSRKNTAKQSLFYAQSWLAVHYLVSKKDYVNKVNRYFKAINQENAPENIFETSFGISPNDFGELLKDYYKKGKYNSLAIKLAKTDYDFDIKTRRLSKGEVEFHHGEAARRFLGERHGSQISEKYYQRAIEASYAPAQINASRALIAIENKDEDSAIKHITAALAQRQNDSRILQIAGHVHLGQYKNIDTASNTTQIKKARAYLKQALRANPHNMEAHYDYVSTYAAANDSASGQAIYSAEECSYYYKSSNFIDSNLLLAEVLLKNGEFEKAQPILKKAAIWSSSDKIRSQAKSALNARH